MRGNGPYHRPDEKSVSDIVQANIRSNAELVAQDTWQPHTHWATVIDLKYLSEIKRNLTGC